MSGARPPSPLERAFHGADIEVVEPASAEEIADAALTASAAGRCVIPCGAGTQAHTGVPPRGPITLISTRHLRSICRYKPDDFTIGVECGIGVTELREELAANRQEIPVDVPQAWGGTTGGWLAAGLPGPRHGRHGSLRNWLIGIRGLRGGAPLTPFKSGGMVVKNVAGYDLGKFFVGSLGTAGFVLEANFKLKAIPPRRTVRLAGFSQRRRANRLAQAIRGRRLGPTILTVIDGGTAARLAASIGGIEPTGHWVMWMFEGHPSAVAWQEEQVDAILEGRDSDDIRTLEDGEIRAAVDGLGEMAAPTTRSPPDETPRVPENLGIAVAHLLPGEALEGWRELADAVEGEGGSVASTVCALSGSVLLRWQTSPSRVDQPIRSIRATLEARRRTGAILYLPPKQREKHPWLLSPDPAASVATRVRSVFDPAAQFSAHRVLGPVEEER